MTSETALIARLRSRELELLAIGVVFLEVANIARYVLYVADIVRLFVPGFDSGSVANRTNWPKKKCHLGQYRGSACQSEVRTMYL
jgi:hypothetical protein